MNYKFVSCFRTSFLVIFTYIYQGASLKGVCPSDPFGCCPFTQWDSYKEQCVDCPPGYFWINCSMMCEYPTFGKRCAQNCSCEKHLCHLDLGCQEYKVRDITVSVYQGNPLKDNEQNIVKSVSQEKDSERNTTISVSQRNPFEVNGQTTTQCPVWKPDNGKRNMIRISLIVITMVLAVICIAYFALLVFEKYLVKKHREENIYVNQVITA